MSSTAVWIIVTLIVQPGLPPRLAMLEGNCLGGETQTFESLQICEAELQEIFIDRPGYSLRRTVQGDLQGVRNGGFIEEDVIMCVEVDFGRIIWSALQEQREIDQAWGLRCR